MLNRKNQTLQDIVSTLQLYHDNVDDAEPSNDDSEQGLPRKAILEGLIGALGEAQ